LTTGIETTLRLLKRTPNEAALRVLISAMDSPREQIRQAAMETLLKHRNLAGHKAVLSRLHTLDENQQRLVMRNSARMCSALRFAVLGTDRQLCENGCACAVRFREYDLICTLISAVEDQANPNADLVGKTLRELASALSKELLSETETSDHRGPKTVLKYVMPSLSKSVDRFGIHGRRETIECFALLVQRDNVTLGQILMAPRHPAFLVLVEMLAGSRDEAIIELILSFLDDAGAPSSILSAATKRRDLDFIRRLLEKIGHQPSLVLQQNLKRMGAVPWLASGAKVIDRLNDAEQHSAVKLAMLSGTTRENAFSLVQHILLHGQPAGRCAASEALDEFNGAAANALTLEALNDPNPRVQANATRQIRRRGIPGALPLLVKMVDSPHVEVREAACKNLGEFSFKRFLGAFDVLDDEVRHGTGDLVKKIDPNVMPLLAAELTSKVRTRRLRGLAIARTLNVVGQLEDAIIGLLLDEDHIVRADAASTLGECRMSPPIAAALTATLKDSSAAVRRAARKTLKNQFASANE
jgi:HEAT repeat protein